MQASGTSADQRVVRVCRALARHDSRLDDWSIEKQGHDLRVEFRIGNDRVRVLVQEASADRAWARTASLAFSIQPVESEAVRMGVVEPFLRQFVQLVDRADHGQLVLARPPEAEQPVRSSSPRAIPVDPEAAERAAKAHRELADELHYASFVAYKATVTTDLYPHTMALGDPIDTQAIVDGWKDTVSRIGDGRAPDKLGLYVHIPFCAKACTFCYCAKTDVFGRDRFSRYIDRLAAQFNLFGPLFAERLFTSVYFGGGTPSLLPAGAMSNLFDLLHGRFDVPEGTQIIFEGNPDSLNDQKIGLMADKGRVTRLTIGVQTLDEAVQKHVHRWNTHRHVREAIASGRTHGIAHINTDLMAGLPGQTMDSFQSDFEFLLELEPDSLHINAYRPLPRTGLEQAGTSMDEEQLRLRDEMVEWAKMRLADSGHADASGQGHRRTRDAANIQEYDLRRQNSSLLGLGFPASSHAFGNWFYQPQMQGSFDDTLDAELEGPHRWTAVPSSDEEERHKYLASNLRTGFTRAEFSDLFGMDVEEAVPDAIEQLKALGVVRVDEEEVYSHTGTHSQNATYRVLLYSPAMMERIDRVWGAEYDPNTDYDDRLRTLVEAHQ